MNYSEFLRQFIGKKGVLSSAYMSEFSMSEGGKETLIDVQNDFAIFEIHKYESATKTIINYNKAVPLSVLCFQTPTSQEK